MHRQRVRGGGGGGGRRRGVRQRRAARHGRRNGGPGGGGGVLTAARRLTVMVGVVTRIGRLRQLAGVRPGEELLLVRGHAAKGLVEEGSKIQKEKGLKHENRQKSFKKHSLHSLHHPLVLPQPLVTEGARILAGSRIGKDAKEEIRVDGLARVRNGHRGCC